MKKYIKIEGTENQFLKVRVYYELGGRNYWSGGIDARGYYLSVQKVTLEQSNGFTSESFMIGSGGVRSLLVEVKRQSDKAKRQAEELAKSKEADLISSVLGGRY